MLDLDTAEALGLVRPWVPRPEVAGEVLVKVPSRLLNLRF